MTTSMFTNDVCAHGLYNFCAKCHGSDDAVATREIFETVMALPTAERKAIRFAGPRVIGFRAFDSRTVDATALFPLGVSEAAWGSGDQPAAICARGDHHPQGKPIVSLACSCGYHAYKDLASMRRGIAHDGPDYRWVGAVIGWGRIAPHVDGWRAERVRLVALFGASHMPFAEATAERYGVPLFRYDLVGKTSAGISIGARVSLRSIGLHTIGFVIGDSKQPNRIRVAVDGGVRTVDASDARVVDPAHATDGASRFFATYEEGAAALEAWAQQFGTPLDDVYAKYATVTRSRAQTPASIPHAIPHVATSRGSVTASTITRKRLYDGKWREAKRAGAAAFARFKADWAAGRVTPAWRP